MKAAIALDDWKLVVFRKRLTEAGYEYEDAGEFTPGVTILHVEYTELRPLATLVAACQDECERSRSK